MHVANLAVGEDAALPDSVRVSARIRYDDAAVDETIWFDVPRPRNADRLESGNPWLIALLPLAATLGEPLRVDAPVDGTLLENARELLSVWHAWHPALPGTSIEATSVHDSGKRALGTGALFSGGADSLYTFLRARAVSQGSGAPLPALVTVHGFDIPLDDVDAYSRLVDRHTRFASGVGCDFFPVSTNLRSTRWRTASWEHLAHGCGLVAVGHLLDDRIGRLLVPSGIGYWDLRPWGSHPITDPLLSSSRLQTVHHGAGARRFEKFERLASEPMALEVLRVCWREESDANCGRCSKCVRAMSALDLLGVLDRAATFPPDAPSRTQLERIHCTQPGHLQEVQDQIERARSLGRDDHAAALERALRGSARRAHVVAAARRVGGPSFGRSVEERLLRGWAR